MVQKSVQTPFSRLTTFREKEPRPVPLIIWATGCEDGRIVCRPHVVTGPVRHFILKLEVPPEWLARAIPLNLDDEEENESCR